MDEPLRSLKPTRRAVLAGMALTALAPLGCFRKFIRQDTSAVTKPTGNGLVVAAWRNKVSYAPDPSRGGAEMPGLVGRVWLLGSDGKHSQIGDGGLSIRLYDATPRGDAEPVLTDIVDIDANTLRKFVTNDFVGPGYTVFFPWFNYRPEVSQAYIVLEYHSPTLGVFTHQTRTFGIDHTETTERTKKGMPAYKPPTIS